MMVQGSIWNKIKAIVYPPGWFPPDSKLTWWGWFRMADTEQGIPKVWQKISNNCLGKLSYFILVLYYYS